MYKRSESKGCWRQSSTLMIFRDLTQSTTIVNYDAGIVMTGKLPIIYFGTSATNQIEQNNIFGCNLRRNHF